MNYNIALLTDSPTSKTVCISPTLNPSAEQAPTNRLLTQILRVFLPNGEATGETMITVIIKGVELALPQVETIVQNFFTERIQQNTPDVLTINNEGLANGQARKSKMNSTLSSSPPKAI